MLQIDRVSWRQPRYTVRDDDGHSGIWVRRRFGEAMTGEIAGKPYELRRDGRRHLSLVSAGSVLATADAAKSGRWTIAAEGSAYQLRRKSAWRSEMELCRDAIAIGSIRKERPPRRSVLCTLPPSSRPPCRRSSGSSR